MPPTGSTTRDFSGARPGMPIDHKDDITSKKVEFPVSENFDNHYDEKKKDLQREMLTKI